jgi:CheY-like chemotaxis protein
MEKRIKVLLVDDEADFVDPVKVWLESKGYDVIAAFSGANGINMIKKENPDILLLDLRMPGMDGVETLRRIREFDKDLPVIIISAYVNDPNAGQVTSYGVSGVFYKDKKFEEVLPLLESALRTHRKLK